MSSSAERGAVPGGRICPSGRGCKRSAGWHKTAQLLGFGRRGGGQVRLQAGQEGVGFAEPRIG
ncbi:MAG: hypothetical protein MZV63_07235 [Marinilabiliales bacterium]|nr:hypothetical protein [Marinilabiliales bacterium]